MNPFSRMVNFVRNLSWAPTDSRWYGPLGRMTSAGIEVNDDIAMTYSAVWACTRLISATGACLPWNLHRRTGNSTSIAVGHPVQRILHDVWNDETMSLMGRSTGTGQQVNNGNFYAEIERDLLERPIKLHPIHYTRVTPRRANEELARSLQVPLKSLVFEVKNDDGQPPTFIANKDMFHVPSMVSANGIIGKGVIENARDTIAMGLATERQGAAYQKNAFNPSLAIVPGPGRHKPEDMEYYRKTWEEVHKGPENRGRPAMVPAGGDVKVLSFSPEDSQFLQTRKHNVEEVARWYGIPPHMVQQMDRATFSNIEHQGIEFVVYSLIPWLEIWDKVAWMKLLSPVEQRTMFAKHNIEGLLRGDSKSRAEFYEKMWRLGVFSINDILLKEDMNPIGPNGDKRFVQTSYTTLEKIGEEPSAPAIVATPTADRDEADAAKTDDGAELAEFITSRLDEHQRVTMSQIDGLVEYVAKSPQQSDSGSSDVERRVAALEESAMTMLADALRRGIAREKTALAQYCKKQPREFIQCLDEFYDRHLEALRAELVGPARALQIAQGEYDTGEMLAATLAELHVGNSRELTLQATEIQSEEWDSLPGRIELLTADWDCRITTELEELKTGVKS